MQSKYKTIHNQLTKQTKHESITVFNLPNPNYTLWLDIWQCEHLMGDFGVNNSPTYFSIKFIQNSTENFHFSFREQTK